MEQSRAKAILAAAVLASSARAEFIGWTATVRPANDGFLVNVFAATNDPGDVILSLSGGQDGYVRAVNMPGGFRQGGDAAGVFRPTSGQSWSTLDSFLTVGGGFDSATGTWRGNVVTEGDPPWLVTYNDSQSGESVTVNGFSTWSNSTGFTNPYVHVVPPTGGWFIAGASSPARSLAPIQAIRLPFQSIDGQAYGASSPAAAAASHGFLVGQLWVPSLTDVGQGGSIIEWRMRAFVRQPNGFVSSSMVAFRIKGTANPDADGDGVPNFEDPCPSQPGPCNGCPVNICGNCNPVVDSDGDSRPDCIDNCPSVPNPGQADCDGDGVGDACESAADCNSNGIPDTCDVAGGTSPDCNGNGVPDACDIASGTSNDVDGNGIPDECKPDCNGNSLPDPWEISTGQVPDCNGDMIPDTCQGAVAIDATSPNLGAPSGTDPREHVFGGLPLPSTGASLQIDLRGDLDGQTEFVDVSVNGGAPRRFFVADGRDCPETPDRATLTWSAEEFAALISGSQSLAVRMTCPAAVDPTECKGAGLTVFRLRYFGIGPDGDCNLNRRLDICDVAGGSPDCNGNRVPDSCDIAAGSAPDCNGNGIPDPCEIASSPAIDCNGNGIPDTCDIAAGGLAVDCDSDGRIDSCQVAENPAVDCNSNGIPDACDIATGGLAVDCDSNGRIDSCQVAENPAVDCNSNGKPDSCDISGGTSLDIDGNGRPDECQTVQVPGDYPTIQAAISAAPGSEMRIVSVAAGTHAGPIDFLGKPVIVRGASAADTVLQGTGGLTTSVVRFSGGEPAIAALERCTVRGGATGSPLPGAPQFLVGGGVLSYESAASVRDCVIEQNFASFGGGGYWIRSTGRIERCIVRGNSAGADGGGVQLFGGSVSVVDATIEGNTSNGRGGGIHAVDGRPTLLRSTIRGNSSSSVVGGVSWVPAGSAVAFMTIEESIVTGNAAGVVQGGIGIQPDGPTVRISLAGTTVCSNLPGPNIFGAWIDLGGNSVCTCIGNLDGDERVSGDDLGILLGAWGPCLGNSCTADLNGDSTVDGNDLGLMLGNWGPCSP